MTIPSLGPLERQTLVHLRALGAHCPRCVSIDEVAGVMGAHTESEVDYITGSIWVLCGPSGPDPTRHPVRARADALVTLMGRNICLTFLGAKMAEELAPAIDFP